MAFARRPLLPFLVLAGLLVAAGCVAPAGTPDPATDADIPTAFPLDWWKAAVPSSLSDEKHDHGNRSQHAGLTTPNFQVVGYDPLVTDHYGSTLTGMGCGGTVTREDGRRIAVVHSISTDVAFVVADVTDPAAPVKLGEFLMPNVVVWDADITADGMHVLVGAYPSGIFGGNLVPELPPAEGPADASGLVAVQPLWRDACTGETRKAGPEQYVPYGPGIVLVGIQDPANPVFEDWRSQPVIGPHSVGSALVDGKLYATASVTNLVHQASYYTFFEVVDTPLGGKLAPLGVIRVPGTTTSLNGHIDVSIQKHPFTQQVLAYLANWDGMYVYDITNPAVPREIAAWKDGNAGSVHTTYPFPVTWGEKHYLAVGQEVGEPVDLPSGWVYLLDVTDPAKPTEVGRWTLPVKPKWDDKGLQFSPHYVAVLNETLFVSNYHGGLWAVNISDPAFPQAVGIFVPDVDSPSGFEGRESYGPSIEDVIVDPATHLLTTWDGAGGVYVLRFDDGMDAPKAPAWGTAEVE